MQVNIVDMKRFQYISFEQLSKDLKRNPNLSIKEKSNLICVYFMSIGGGASEYNILQLMRYVGINFNNDSHLEYMRNALSYYCGAGFMRIIDNKLGIASVLMDTGSVYYQKGKKTDLAKLQKQLDLYIENIKKLFGDEHVQKNR